MADTMLVMDYIHVDNLAVDQLMEDDLVEIGGEIVTVKIISPIKNGYAISFENEFGEKDILEFDDSSIFKLFVLA
jgi:uncharacterized membrane protein (DUF441 family)